MVLVERKIIMTEADFAGTAIFAIHVHTMALVAPRTTATRAADIVSTAIFAIRSQQIGQVRSHGEALYSAIGTHWTNLPQHPSMLSRGRVGGHLRRRSGFHSPFSA